MKKENPFHLDNFTLNRFDSINYRLKMHLKLSLLLVLISSPIVYSQMDFREGYVVNMQKDTIKGFIAYRKSTRLINQCEFKTCNQDHSVIYTTNNLLGYGFKKGRVFETKLLDSLKGTFFYQKMVSGKASLFSRSGKYFLETDSLFQLNAEKVKKKIGQSEVLVPEYLLTLQEKLKNCGGAIFLDKARYNDDDLVRSVSEYNKCINSEYNVFNTSEPASKLEVYIIGGYSLINFEIQGEGQPASVYLLKAHASGPMVGLGFSIFSPRHNDKWAFITELNFTYNKHIEKESIQIPTPSQQLFLYVERENYISLTSLAIPFGIKYNVHNPRSSFALGLGLFYKTYINPEIYSTGYFVENNQVVSQTIKYEYNVQDLPNSGLWVSAGYSTLNIKRKRTFIDLRFSNEFPRGEIQKMINSYLVIGTSF